MSIQNPKEWTEGQALLNKKMDLITTIRESARDLAMDVAVAVDGGMTNLTMEVATVVDENATKILVKDVLNIFVDEFHREFTRIPVQKEEEEKKEYCSRCGQELDLSRIVWFEVNCRTHEVWETTDESSKPDWSDTEDSQGCFPYGPDCAKHVRKKGEAIFG